MSSDQSLNYLRLALAEATKAEPTPTAFCVGCVITLTWPLNSDNTVVLATGYSRELPGNTHAEANALSKASALSTLQLSALFPTFEATSMTLNDLLVHADVYTTMEPCSIRTSGLSPCADALIAAKVKRCFIGVGEPADFVNCEGARKLKEAGIDVIWMNGLEEECLRVARRGHSASAN